MTKNREQSGKAVASAAGKVLADPKASAAAKSAAASTLTQRGAMLERTGRAAASAAGKVLGDPKASAAAKSAAASALTQRRDKKR